MSYRKQLLERLHALSAQDLPYVQVELLKDIASFLDQLAEHPILLAAADRTSAVSANTNLVDRFLTVSSPPAKVRVLAVFDTGGGNLNLIRAKSQSGNPAVTEGYNGALSPTTLNANFGYVFDTYVNKGDWINLQYSVTAKPLTLRIYEMAQS